MEPINQPNWKFIEDSDVMSKFIRSVGPIDIRKTGSKSVSENYYSKAKRGIRFLQLPAIKASDDGNEINITLRPQFRRFFFDGTVCGKYEIGFSFELKKNQLITSQSFNELFTSLSECRVKIPIPYKIKVETTLLDCGRYLAEQYLYATSHRKNIIQDHLQGVYPGFPCIYLEKLDSEIIDGNFIKDSVFVKQPKGVSIGLTKLKINNKLIKVWYSDIDPGMKTIIAREVRIAILRLNVFREALHFVFKKIEENKILPNPRSNESEELQSFFKDCFGQYLRKVPEKLADSDYETMALQIEDKLAVVNRNQLEYNLRKVIDIRGNYFNSIKEYLEKLQSSKKENLNEKEIVDNTTSGGPNIPKVPTGDTNQSKQKILFLAADPNDQDSLQITREYRAIDEQLQKGQKRDLFELLPPKLAVTVEDLIQSMNRKPEIVHFAGHGDQEGILLSDQDNHSFLMPDTALKRLFRQHKDTTRLVVLSACYSADQAETISSLGFYVIGMNSAIRDVAATGFATGLYIGLAAGKTVELSFDDAMILLEAKFPNDAAKPEIWKGGVKMEL